MTLENFSFNVINEDTFSRNGIIKTHRGSIQTPAFMPVGTQATIKGAFLDDVLKTGSEIILCNTYHLMLRPGVERIKTAGGLHKFMNCNVPILVLVIEVLNRSARPVPIMEQLQTNFGLINELVNYDNIPDKPYKEV